MGKSANWIDMPGVELQCRAAGTETVGTFPGYTRFLPYFPLSLPDMWETQLEFLALASALPSPGSCGCLGREPVDGRFLSFSVSLLHLPNK